MQRLRLVDASVRVRPRGLLRGLRRILGLVRVRKGSVMTALAALGAAVGLLGALCGAVLGLAAGKSRRAKAERRVLGFLAHGDWVFGADIIRRCQLGRGAGYWLLDDMEERGLIESRLEPGSSPRLPRRLYRSAEPRHAG